MKISRVTTGNYHNFFQTYNNTNQNLNLNSSISADTYTKATPPADVSFGAAFPLRKVSGIPCPSCGIPMISQKEINEFIANITTARGKNLIRILSEHSKYFHQIEQEFVTDVLKLLHKSPNISLKSAVMTIAPKKLTILGEKQIGVLEQISSQTKQLPSTEFKAVDYLLSCTKKHIQKRDTFNPFRRQRFINDLQEISFNSENKEVFLQLYRTAETLPTQKNSSEALFVGLFRQESDKIGEKIIYPALGTIEHIHPESAGGENELGNYLLMCMECNNARATMPYEEWLRIKPEMLLNIQKYVDYIHNLPKISRNNPFEINDYLVTASKTLFEQSNGLLKMVETN